MSKKKPGRPPKSNHLGSTEFAPSSSENDAMGDDLKKSFDNEGSSDNMPDIKIEERAALIARRKARRSNKSPGAMNQKLAAKPIEGYMQRWVNDDQDRVQRLTDDGYSIVKKNETDAYSTDSGDNVSQVVGSGNQRAVLMKYPIEFHDEDTIAKRALIQQKITGAQKAASIKGPDGESRSYIPGGSSQFEV